VGDENGELQDVVVEGDFRRAVRDGEEGLPGRVYAVGFDSLVEVATDGLEWAGLQQAGIVIEIIVSVGHGGAEVTQQLRLCTRENVARG